MTEQPDKTMGERLREFSDFINEPPQYEDQRMVRDYRHELARKWVPLLELLLRTPAQPHASAERPVAWRRRRKGIVADDGWIMCPLKPEHDSEFELQPLYARKSPAIGGAREALDRLKETNAAEYLRVIARDKKITPFDSHELPRIADLLDVALAPQAPEAKSAATIDSIPSCGSENDYRNARPERERS